MKAVCRTCGFGFDSHGLGKPFCPRCGFDIVDVETQPIRVSGPEIGLLPTVSAPKHDGARIHEEAAAVTVELMCADGHRWAEKLESEPAGDCPHGIETHTVKDHLGQPQKVPRAVQVELVCRCGAALSVVGEVGKPVCPRCGRRMTCPKCLASRRNSQPTDPRCPTCGKPPVDATDTPDVEFGGDVHKIIPGRRRH